MADFFQWLSSGSIFAIILIIVVVVIVIIVIAFFVAAFREGREISFYPLKLGEKPINNTASKNSNKTSKIRNGKNSYGISIDKPAQEQSFYSEQEDMFIEVSGEYEVKPESGKTLRLLTKTPNPIRYWYQSPVPDFSNGRWKAEVGLWKGKNLPAYSATIIVVVVDEASENLIRYAEKVHRETGRNIPFDNLPVYLEMIGEVKVKRE
ncbi:MAG: hypothetical protein IPL71_21675 [Anaerolineales bacterium]|uniref:hypothetical protein n=1 Tax=Candidatus Villigracilis proximus TaxID=3140683 RepID=UPI00313538F7|nr:hypothetical protein [Anaerolineales bacterium]